MSDTTLQDRIDDHHARARKERDEWAARAGDADLTGDFKIRSEGSGCEECDGGPGVSILDGGHGFDDDEAPITIARTGDTLEIAVEKQWMSGLGYVTRRVVLAKFKVADAEDAGRA